MVPEVDSRFGMRAEVKLHLVGSMDQLRILWLTGETLLEQVPFQDEDAATTRYNILVAIQELVTNVYRHGYGDDERGLDVHFAAADTGFEVSIIDDGPAFDPTAGEVADPDPDVMPECEGGYGLMIARMVMDEFSYERIADRNVVRLVKYQRSETPAASLD